MSEKKWGQLLRASCYVVFLIRFFHTIFLQSVLIKKPQKSILEYVTYVLRGNVRENIDYINSKEGKIWQRSVFFKNTYAIVIGIEQYRQKLPKADFAVHDAQTVTEYLTKVMGYPEENIITLKNEHASKSDFENTLKNGSGTMLKRTASSLSIFPVMVHRIPKPVMLILSPMMGILLS